MLIWIIFITSLVVSTIIVNKAQKLFMRVMNADVMFFSMKKKLIAIFVLGLLLCATIIHIFGIEIPKS